MVETYTLFEDIAAIFVVGAIGWIILLFISRGLAWVYSAFVSMLFLLFLVIHDLAALPPASPAASLDMLSATGLCLLVHLVSDLALVIICRRMIMVPVAASADARQTASRYDNHPFCPEPARSLGD